MVPFFSTRYVDTFGVFDVNRAISMLIHGSELVAVAQGAGGILGLSVDFLGSTIRSQKSEHDSARGMSRATRELLGRRASDATCGRQVFPHFPTHVKRLPPVLSYNTMR